MSYTLTYKDITGVLINLPKIKQTFVESFESFVDQKRSTDADVRLYFNTQFSMMGLGLSWGDLSPKPPLNVRVSLQSLRYKLPKVIVHMVYHYESKRWEYKEGQKTIQHAIKSLTPGTDEYNLIHDLSHSERALNTRNQSGVKRQLNQLLKVIDKIRSKRK